MICIYNTNTDPYFNLAAEEYLLKNFQQNIFMLYQDEPSVIMGKHQNVRAEINLDYAEKNHIKVVRRYSGGGTVFHDLGNLNLTFIESGGNLNFDKFTTRMIDMLAKFGIRTETDSRRALNIDGLKISGSAQCVHKDRVMYHATLLFSSDLAHLISSLEGDPMELERTKSRKAYVSSVKSPVTNIIEHLEEPVDIETFRTAIMKYFIQSEVGNQSYSFTRQDIESIEKLKSNKYATKEWNYNAYSI